MNKEIRIGALAIIAIIGLIWGYKFVKGQNLFSPSTTLQTTLDDVTLLSVSSPVFIRGLKVGSVTNIDLDENDLSQMIVTFNVEGDYKIPKSATVFMKSEGLVGGNVLSIAFDKLCNGPDCIEDGDMLKSGTLGLLGSLIGEDEINNITGKLKDTAQGLINNLGNPSSEAALDKIVRDLSTTMEQIALMTKQTNQLLESTNKDMTKTMRNVSTITENLAKNNDQITSILSNLSQTTSKLNNAGIENLVKNTDATIAQATTTLQNLDKTLGNANNTFSELNAVINEVKSGDGTLSKLLNDKNLYNNLEATSANLSYLLQDLRLNPDRYVKVSVFGRKSSNSYTKPEDDPAFKKDDN